MSDCCENVYCKGILLVVGIVFTVVGIVFDWINYKEIHTNVDLENDATKEKEVDECKIQLQMCAWMILAFVIIKMVAAIVEYGVGIYRFVLETCCNDAEPDSCCLQVLINDVTMVIIKIVVSLFECAVLITLLIVANYCLRAQGRNVFPDISPDLWNDFLAGLFGTAGIVVSRIGVRNAMKVYHAARACRNCPPEPDNCNCSNCFLPTVFVLAVIALIVLNGCLIYSYSSV